MAEPEDEALPVLLPCSICSRTFKPESLAKHSKVCEKQLTKKRKIFDSSKQRIQGTELAEFLPNILLEKKSEKVVTKKHVSKWKEKHLEFVRAIRAARGVETGPIKSSSASQPSRSSNHEKCPHCDRNFGPKAFDRHIEWCKEQKARIPKSPASLQAKERLEARTKYRAPPLAKSKRTLTREKYARVSQPGQELSPMGSRSAISFSKTPHVQPHDMKFAEASPKIQGIHRSDVVETSEFKFNQKNTKTKADLSGTRGKPKVSTSSSSCVLPSGHLQTKRREPSPSPSRKLVRSDSKTPKKGTVKTKKEEINNSDSLFTSSCSITKLHPSNERIKGKEGKANPIESRPIMHKTSLTTVKIQERNEDRNKSQIPVIDTRRMRSEGQSLYRPSTYTASSKELHRVNKTRSLPEGMCGTSESTLEFGCEESIKSNGTVDSQEGDTSLSCDTTKRLSSKGYSSKRPKPKLNEVNVNVDVSDLIVSQCSILQPSSNLITWKDIAGKRNMKETGTDLENDELNRTFTVASNCADNDYLTYKSVTGETSRKLSCLQGETHSLIDSHPEEIMKHNTLSVECGCEDTVHDAKLKLPKYFSDEEKNFVNEDERLFLQEFPTTSKAINCTDVKWDVDGQGQLTDNKQNFMSSNIENFMFSERFVSVAEPHKCTEMQKDDDTASGLLDDKHKFATEHQKHDTYSQEQSYLNEYNECTDLSKNFESQSSDTDTEKFGEPAEVEHSELHIVTVEDAGESMNVCNFMISVTDSRKSELITTPSKMHDHSLLVAVDKKFKFPNDFSDSDSSKELSIIEEEGDLESCVEKTEKLEQNISSVVCVTDFEVHGLTAAVCNENENFVCHECTRKEFSNAATNLDINDEVGEHLQVFTVELNNQRSCEAEVFTDCPQNIKKLCVLNVEEEKKKSCNVALEGTKDFFFHSFTEELPFSTRMDENHISLHDGAESGRGCVDGIHFPLCRKSCFCCFEKKGIPQKEAYALWQIHKDESFSDSKNFEIQTNVGTCVKRKKYTSENTVDRIWDLASQEFIKTVKEKSSDICSLGELTPMCLSRNNNDLEGHEECKVLDISSKKKNNQWKMPRPDAPVLFKAIYSFHQHKGRGLHRRHSFAMYRIRKKHKKKVNRSSEIVYEKEEPEVKKRLLHKVSAFPHCSNILPESQKESSFMGKIKTCPFCLENSHHFCNNNEAEYENNSEYIFNKEMLSFDKIVQKRVLCKSKNISQYKEVCNWDHCDLLSTDRGNSENYECHNKLYFDSNRRANENTYVKAACSNTVPVKMLTRRSLHKDFVGESKSMILVKSIDSCFQQGFCAVFKFIKLYVMSQMLHSGKLKNTLCIDICCRNDSIQNNIFNFGDENLLLPLLFVLREMHKNNVLQIKCESVKEEDNKLISVLYDSNEIFKLFVSHDVDQKCFQDKCVLKELSSVKNYFSNIKFITKGTYEDRNVLAQNVDDDYGGVLKVPMQHTPRERNTVFISKLCVDKEIADVTFEKMKLYAGFEQERYKGCVLNSEVSKYHEDKNIVNEANGSLGFADNDNLLCDVVYNCSDYEECEYQREVATPLSEMDKEDSAFCDYFSEAFALNEAPETEKLGDSELICHDLVQDIISSSEFGLGTSDLPHKVLDNSNLMHNLCPLKSISQDQSFNSGMKLDIPKLMQDSSRLDVSSDHYFQYDTDEVVEEHRLATSFKETNCSSIEHLHVNSFNPNPECCSPDTMDFGTENEILFQSLSLYVRKVAENKTYNEVQSHTQLAKQQMQSQDTVMTSVSTLHKDTNSRHKFNEIPPVVPRVSTLCYHHNELQRVINSEGQLQSRNFFSVNFPSFLFNEDDSFDVKVWTSSFKIPRKDVTYVFQTLQNSSRKSYRSEDKETLKKFNFSERLIQNMCMLQQYNDIMFEYTERRSQSCNIVSAPYKETIASCCKYAMMGSPNKYDYLPEAETSDFHKQTIYRREEIRDNSFNIVTHDFFCNFRETKKLDRTILPDIPDIQVHQRNKIKSAKEHDVSLLKLVEKWTTKEKIRLQSAEDTPRTRNLDYVRYKQPTPKVHRLPPMLTLPKFNCHSRSCSEDVYDPYISAERQMMELLSQGDCVHQPHQQKSTLPSQADTSTVFPSFESSHRSAFVSPEPPRAFPSSKSHLEKGDADKKAIEDKFASKSESSVGNELFAQLKCHSAGGKFSADSAYGSLNRRSPMIPGGQKLGKSDVDIGDGERLCFMSSSSSESSLPPLCTVQVLKHEASNPSSSPTSSPAVETSPISQSVPRMSKFCHECGSKYPVSLAKFCCECGVRRLAM